jgi:uncharacterized protein with GYD domain
MPKILSKISFSPQGVQTLLTRGVDGFEQRLQEVADSLGLTFEHHWFAFGETDLYAVADAPDNATAAAAALRSAASPNIASVETVILLSSDEMRAALEKTAHAPG